MEKNELMNSSSSSLYGMEISPHCFLPTTFDDPNDRFESALSSMVSSPTSNGGGFISGDGMMIRELIGRLGSICNNNSGDFSPQSCIATANNTPLNSPPKFNLSPLSLLNHASGSFQNHHPPSLGFFNGGPGFAERAAKFSSFGRGETGVGNGSGTNLQNVERSRVSSNVSSREGNSQFDGISGVREKNNGEMGDSREGSSVSEQNNPTQLGEIGVKLAQNDANSRKRKSSSKAKVKESHSLASPPEVDKGEAEAENDGEEGSNAKRSKTDDEESKRENRGQSNNSNKDKQGNSNSKNKEEAAKTEPPKDYIHVRARRGQATDSHSLAERVRREKISERMKLLQDLVPGCNKVTGKATVLDEIINYVQSLQRQVEFLSMKLANVNPSMDFNNMLHSQGSPLPQTMYPLDQNSAQAYPFGYQSSQQLPPTLLNGILNGGENPFSMNPLNGTGIHRNPTPQLPSIGELSHPMTQLPNFWDDDLQSIVQMGISQNQTQTGAAGLGTLSNAQMKVEL